MQFQRLVFAAAMAVVPGLLYGQVDFHLAGRDVQIHSFASQGFIYSNDNNYLTMDTSRGSFAFTDMGGNISTRINDHFRVGAQLYLRNVGAMGNFHPTLDWALGDYKFKSWFGIRGGRVKTTLGLYNDIQDMDSLHTFALLPESIYPVDWRSATIAHDGGDVYGDITIKHLGTFSYTGYAGMRPQDSTQGYIYAYNGKVDYTYLGGLQVGGDFRWNTPVGALFGVSYRNQDLNGEGTTTWYGPKTVYSQTTNADQLVQYYGQYTLRGLRLDVEYRRNIRDSILNLSPTSPFKSIVDTRAWYVAGTYRISKRLEVGAYRSVYLVDDRKDTAPASAHQYDTVIAGRVNLFHGWYAKVEGHFFDGAPTSPSAARGFYALANPAGVQPTTNMLVVRTGISF